jgi:hypothetical protein
VTGALDRSDRCEPFVGFVSGDFLTRVSLGRVGAGQFLAGLEVF